jgi:hypothetical protein
LIRGNCLLRASGKDPFDHWVFDDFLSDGIAEKVLSRYPDLVTSKNASVKKAFHSRKKHYVNKPPDSFFSEIYEFFKSDETVSFLSEISGIEGLKSDPQDRGAGLHEISNGGFLRIHADFSHHPGTGDKRVLNLLYFLNKDWDDAWNGNLELWDESMTSCKVSINPSFNRVAIFKTSEKSYHGHPTPLSAPDGRTRKAMAFYYYVDGDLGADRHGTIYQNRPGEDDLGGGRSSVDV